MRSNNLEQENLRYHQIEIVALDRFSRMEIPAMFYDSLNDKVRPREEKDISFLNKKKEIDFLKYGWRIYNINEFIEYEGILDITRF